MNPCLRQELRTEPRHVLLCDVNGVVVSVLDGARLVEAARVAQPGQLGRPALGEEDVARLDRAMHDALRMDEAAVTGATKTLFHPLEERI